MDAPLFCGADGCTLHDYPVAPIFCEFAFQNDRVLKVREDEERRFNRLIERLVPAVAKSLGDAVFDAIDNRDTERESYDANTRRESPPASQNKTKKGGFAV